MTPRATLIALLAAILLAAALRLPLLSARPMHGDEAVHAVRFVELWLEGRYQHEYHGPTLYYLALPVVWVSGAASYAELTEWLLRLAPALCGVALVALLVLLRDALGRAAVLCAALLSAVSPALVYYSRYFIQETPLVLFSLLLIAAGWRCANGTGGARLGWAIVARVAAGLMHATKETCIIAWAAMGVGLLCAAAPDRRRAWAMLRDARLSVAVALLAAVAVSVALFSTFFTHAAGPLDSLRAFGVYIARGASGVGPAGPHDHPWHYYLSLLWHRPFGRPGLGDDWSEAPILLLALAGLGVAPPRAAPAGRSPAFLPLVAGYAPASWYCSAASEPRG